MKMCKYLKIALFNIRCRIGILHLCFDMTKLYLRLVRPHRKAQEAMAVKGEVTQKNLQERYQLLLDDVKSFIEHKRIYGYVGRYLLTYYFKKDLAETDKLKKLFLKEMLGTDNSVSEVSLGDYRLALRFAPQRDEILKLLFLEMKE